MNKRTLFIGGSPCSGKSTLAEMLYNDYKAYYFKVDDHLEEYIDKAAEEGKKTCRKYKELSPDEIWMKDPYEHCQDEFRIYEEISPYIFEKIEEIDADLIVTEGAAYTPEVMKKHGYKDYVTLIPTPEFQIEHYRKREWVKYVMADCIDKRAAFDNWMKRDILFGKQVKKQCIEKGITCIVNDGSKTIEELYKHLKREFNI